MSLQFSQKKIIKKKWFFDIKGPYVTFYDLWGQTSYQEREKCVISKKNLILSLKLPFVTLNDLWGHT